eukprot:1378048-Amphidinium_carterae.1
MSASHSFKISTISPGASCQLPQHPCRQNHLLTQYEICVAPVLLPLIFNQGCGLLEGIAQPSSS